MNKEQVKELAERNAVYEFNKIKRIYDEFTDEYVRHFCNKLAELRGGIDDVHTCNCQHNSDSRDNEPCCRCDSKVSENDDTKNKVTSLKIIVRMIDNKPYYEIKYKKVGEDYYQVGYSSFNIDNVLKWRDECFELVYVKTTNADRIRNMSDEELASVLFSGCIDSMDLEECPYASESELDNNKIRKICKKCTLEWLQSEAE